MTNIALAPAELIGVVLESAAYGVYLVLFIGCVYTLSGRYKRKRNGKLATRKANRPMFFASVILFVCITLHWVLEIGRLYGAYVVEIAFPGPEHYYSNLANPLNVAKTGLYLAEFVVADGIIVYRLWTVWNGNWSICVPPACTLLAEAVVGTATTYQFTRVRLGQDIFETECGRWITSSFVLQLFTNIYCAGLIAFRIWSINRSLKSIGQTDLTPVIMIVVESAALYTFMTLLTMILYLAGSNAQFTALNITIPVIGLTFSLIIIRVSLGISHNGAETTQATTTLRTPHTERSNATQSRESYRMEPIAISVQKEVDRGPLDYKIGDNVYQDAQSVQSSSLEV